MTWGCGLEGFGLRPLARGVAGSWHIWLQELHDSGEAEFGAAAWRAGVEEAAEEAAVEAAAAAAAAAATPMTREQAEYTAELAEWQRQQDEWQRGQEAVEAARRHEMESSMDQLDAVLQGIDGGGGATAGGGAASGGGGVAPGEDPLAELYSSIAASADESTVAAVAGGVGGAGAMGAADLDAVELPPGVRRTKLPAPWLEYQDPGTGHSYFVNPQSGASQWARPG